MNTLYNYENFRSHRVRHNPESSVPPNNDLPTDTERTTTIWEHWQPFLAQCRVFGMHISQFDWRGLAVFFAQLRTAPKVKQIGRWLPVVLMSVLAWYVWTHDFVYQINIFGYKMLLGTRVGIAQYGQKSHVPIAALPPLSTLKKEATTPKIVATTYRENPPNNVNVNSEIRANTFMNVSMFYEPNVTPNKTKEEKCRDYIARFLKVAQAERAKFGIPVSIKLAQGLLESDAGDSRLTRLTNNHFGVKTFSKNVPHKVFKDDTPTDKFKLYETAWASYRDHSLLLMKTHYKYLQNLSSKDYMGWAKGLQRCGYATDPQYTVKLVQIIHRLNLDKFDQ